MNPKDYWERRLKENASLHGTGFLGLGRNYNNWMYRIRKKIFLHKMKSMHIDFKNTDILDIGSGTGFYVGLWKELGVRSLVGIDITNISVEYLKRQYPNEEFYQLDIGGEEEQDDDSKIDNIRRIRKYDIVSGFDVLFHIVDDKRYDQAIKNVHSLLKPDGFFVFSDNFVHKDTIRSVHQVSRTLNIIEKTLIRNGFEIVERCPMFVLMNAPIDSTKHINNLFWKAIVTSIRCNEIIGLILGGILYPLELILTSLMKETCSTEMMICRRSNLHEDISWKEKEEVV